MINKAFEVIIREITPFIESQNLKKQEEDGYLYANGSKAVRVYYQQDKKVFKLDVADLNDGEEVQFKNCSAFLFDDTHNEKDAKAIGVDFLETLNGVFGIKSSAIGGKSQVVLPKKNSGTSTPNIEAFCGKFLSLFPQYKDMYKENVSTYGAFMYEDFFTKSAAVKLNELANNQSETKNFNKLLNFLDQYFVDGDFIVQSVITYSIIGEACVNNKELFAVIEPGLKKTAPHLYQSAKAMIEYRAKKG